MFKSTSPKSEQSLFSGISQHLGNKKLNKLTDAKTWYNVFFQEITSQIREDIFQSLYSNNNGRPNASIRRLVAMIILKEGQNWTDEQLYENCHFNIVVMQAIGLSNVDEEVPVESTYYDFKSKLVQHHRETGENLFEILFREITGDQIKKFNVNGRIIRMDSKLIQSNIKTGCQLHKVLETLQFYFRSQSKGWEKQVKKKSDRKFIKEIMSKPVSNHLYGMTKDEKSTWLRRLGFLIRKVLNIFQGEDSEPYNRLSRMYEEHYIDTEEKGNPPRPKEKEEMKADGIQSVHDPDAAYRSKGQGNSRQQVSGYSANITETAKGDLRLITDVQVEKATQSDSSYLEVAAQKTTELTDQPIEQVHTDGGYDSIENRTRFADYIGQEWHLAKCIGGKKRCEFKHKEDGTILILDPATNSWVKAEMSRNGKYRIPTPGRTSKYRYFKKEQVKAGIELAKVRPKEIDGGIRANMESTIHQVFHTLSAGKSKYRGLLKHKLFVTSRALWINCKRIKVQTGKKSIFESIFMQFELLRHHFCSNNLTLFFATRDSNTNVIH